MWVSSNILRSVLEVVLELDFRDLVAPGGKESPGILHAHLTQVALEAVLLLKQRLEAYLLEFPCSD